MRVVRPGFVVLVLSLLVVAGCDNSVIPPKGGTVPRAAGQSEPVADGSYPQYGNASLDVLHYGLELAWAPDSKTLTGTATVTVRAVRAVPEISLDFASTYTIESTTVDGATVAGAAHGTKLIVPAALERGRTVRLVVRYHGLPVPLKAPTQRDDATSAGLSVTDDGSLWALQEPYGAFTWYPVNDIPSDKALYDFAVTVPDGWTAVTSGTPQGRVGNTFRFTSKDPMASYLATLAVGHYKTETLTGPHGLPVNLWAYTDTGTKEMGLLRHAPAMLTWLEGLFGPYPFPTAGVVLVPNGTAEETQQAVTMDAGDLRADSIDALLVHEFAHHWFGDTVTPSTWQDLWLNEGFAEYAEIRYDAGQAGLSLDRVADLTAADDGRARAEYGPPGHPKPADFAESNVYICGALMLIEIEKTVGESAFLSLLRDWAQEHRGTNQSRASFIAFANRHTGQDLTNLINTWLDSPTTPSIIHTA